jgi:hypothetical protein
MIANMDASDFVGILVSLAALTLGIVNFMRTSRISDRQFVVQFTQDSQKWASSVLECFTDLIDPSFSHSPDRKEKISKICARVSVLWDEGRLLFPNDVSTNWGASKESAYRGIRHSVLDVMHDLHNKLVKEYQMLRDNPGAHVDSTPYADLKRRFVSEVLDSTGVRSRYDLVRKRLI